MTKICCVNKKVGLWYMQRKRGASKPSSPWLVTRDLTDLANGSL